MRVLHSFLFFSINFAGGTSDLMFKILNAQSKASKSPVLLTGDYKFDKMLFSQLENVEIIKSRSYFDRMGFSVMPSLIFQLIINRKKFDVVHMHVFRSFQSAVLFVFCRLFKVKYVVDAHGAVPYHYRKVKLKKLFDLLIGRRILRNAHKIIAETEVGKQEYIDIDPKLPEEKITILSPPFDTNGFDPIPTPKSFKSRFKIPKNKKIICFLGRLHFSKGNDFLIDGFSHLTKKRSDCHLVLIGPDDGHEKILRDMVKKHGITKNVTFTGFMGGSEKNEALAASDIVVQLSRFEQGAWAPMEGVLCGTPIVVTSETGTGEDVRRLDAGYTVPFNDIEGLSKTFDYILNNYKVAVSKTLKARKYIISNLSMNARISEYFEIFK